MEAVQNAIQDAKRRSGGDALINVTAENKTYWITLILPVLALATPLGDTMLLGFLPLSGAFVAAAGFGGLVLEKQLLES